MRPLRKITFLLEEFQVPSPAQQLLDRFLLGYPRAGKFHALDGLEVSACLLLNNSENSFGKRREDFSFRIKANPAQAVRDADAIVMVPHGAGAVANDGLLRVALENTPEGAACFVHGALASSLEKGRQLAKLAETRKISLLAGTPTAVTWRFRRIEPLRAFPLGGGGGVGQGPSLVGRGNGVGDGVPSILRARGGGAGLRAI